MGIKNLLSLQYEILGHFYVRIEIFDYREILF